jgi:hypothetical protein
MGVNECAARQHMDAHQDVGLGLVFVWVFGALALNYKHSPLPFETCGPLYLPLKRKP